MPCVAVGVRRLLCVRARPLSTLTARTSARIALMTGAPHCAVGLLWTLQRLASRHFRGCRRLAPCTVSVLSAKRVLKHCPLPSSFSVCEKWQSTPRRRAPKPRRLLLPRQRNRRAPSSQPSAPRTSLCNALSFWNDTVQRLSNASTVVALACAANIRPDYTPPKLRPRAAGGA